MHNYYKRISLNLFSLLTVQFFSNLLPIIILPYILRIVGLEKYGVTCLLFASINYFSTFVDYGYTLTAVREVSISRNNLLKLQEIYNKVMSIRLLLCIVGLLVLNIFIFFNNGTFFFLLNTTYLYVFAQNLFPVWFFQGVENLKLISTLSLIGKILYGLLIFLIVRSENDYIYINLLNSVCILVIAIYANIEIRSKYDIIFKFITFKKLKLYLISNFNISLSFFLQSVYINSNLIVLGYVGSAAMVGYYNLADKILGLARQLLSVIFNATYSTLCSITNEYNALAVNKYIAKMIFVLFTLFSLLSLFIFFLSDQIVTVVNGTMDSQASNVLRILAFVPVVVALNLPFNQILLAYERNNQYLLTFWLASIVNLVINFMIVPKFFHIGSAISCLVTELLVTIILMIFSVDVLKKNFLTSIN
ncbi:MAG: oligosaccharide flippase family protein [Cytophagales bacterium]